jgi:hypothetical protein
MSPSTLEPPNRVTSPAEKKDATWVHVFEIGATNAARGNDEPWVDVVVYREDEDDDPMWAEVRNMEPSGDELDRLVDQFPAPDDWFEEWLD